MPSLSAVSAARLATCDVRLQALFQAVAAHVDCLILEGFRDQATQDAAFAAGRSKLRWPHGKHNRQPSLAVDAAPLPIDWADRERLHLFAGFVLGLARAQGVAVRWGGDWNGNFQVADNRFDDLVHFELVEA
jgi:peptidoglycan L-alanyl-D-glutamate endopeptidase CwlK